MDSSTASSTANSSNPKVVIGLPNDEKCEKDEFTLDSILIRIGQFGKFQIIIFLLICLPMMFNAIFSVTYVFTASSVVHR